MDGSGSGQREIQSPPVSTPCRRTGCVFYAHNMFDGMCSKCFKDLQEQMQSSSHAPSTTTATSNNNSSTTSSTTSIQLTPSDEITLSSNSAEETATVASPAVARKDSTLTTPSVSNAKSELDSAVTDTASSKEKAKKKRCNTCKKRVGLTGFDCRCGGHYCSVHRYSDMHGCSFDYHELAQSEIRRQNPVVAAEKIKKI